MSDTNVRQILLGMTGEKRAEKPMMDRFTRGDMKSDEDPGPEGPSHQPIPSDELSPVVRRASDPAMPAAARLMVARGLAGLAPADLVTAQYVLTFDAEREVRHAAASALARVVGVALPFPKLNARIRRYLETRLG
jgi:hypothetical protein